MTHVTFPMRWLDPCAALAQTPPILRMVVPLAIVLALAGVLLAAVSIVRRKLRDDAASSTPRDFSLGDLRGLHRAGKLTDEEFERAKAKLVDSTRSTLAKDKRPSMAEKPFGEEPKE